MIRTDGPLEVGGVKASGETFPLQIDNSGNLKVTGGGGGGGGTSSDFGAAFPTAGTAAGFLDSAGVDMAAGNLDASGNLKVAVENASIAVTGPLTDTQLRATAVPVSLASAPSTSVTQGTSPWITAGGGTAGTAASGVVTIQGIASMTPVQVSQATAASLNATVTGSGSAGTAASGVVTVQGIASMTKLLVTPDSVALPANQSVNVSQINAATPLMGSGNTGTGSLRVTIATDQPQLTNKLLVTPDANSAVNIAQMNGTTVTMGNGTSGTGVQRVTIASDSTGVVGLSVGANLIGYVGNKWTFGSKTTLATTSFTSLTNGSGWQSASISSTARDYIVRIQTKGQTSGINYVDFYVAVSISSDSTFTDGATGSEGTFTAGNRLNSRYLGSVKINAGTAAVQAAFNLTDAFQTVPGKFAFIAINNSGATMSATAGDHVFDVESVN